MRNHGYNGVEFHAKIIYMKQRNERDEFEYVFVIHHVIISDKSCNSLAVDFDYKDNHKHII